ncbi:MAG: AsmA family protein [Candidatus Omnitrophota bacterium]
MKVLKIIFIALALLITAIIIIALILIKSFDVNRYKAQIIAAADKALNRQLNFSRANLDVSFTKGITLKIRDITVSDDPDFSKDKFLKVKDILVTLDLLKYFSIKEVNIPALLIDAPWLKIIRKKDGSINVATIAQASSIQTNPGLGVAVLPAIMINSLKSGNGRVSFIDNSFEPPLNLEINDLSIQFDKISLSEPFPFLVEASVLSSKKNIRIDGLAQINLKSNEVIITNLKGSTELSNILLDRIPVIFPLASGVVLPESLKGQMELKVDKVSAGAKGLSDFMAHILLPNAILKFNELGSLLTVSKMEMRVTPKDIFLDKALLSIGTGLVDVSAGLSDYLGKQKYNFLGYLTNLKIEEIVDTDKMPAQAEGEISGKVKAWGAGFTPQDIQSNLSAELDLSVSKGKLKGINVLRAVLDKISIIPGLSQKIEEGLPERFKQKLVQKDTLISDTRFIIGIENGKIMLKETTIGADEFLFKGQGESDFNGAFRLEGQFLISAELSSSMVAQVSQLQYLLNDAGQIYLPLKISGAAKELQFILDTDYIARKLLAEQGKKQLFNILDKVFGVSQPEISIENTTTQNETVIKPSAQESIGGILRGILR